jgi:hypothetical protein
VLWEAIGAIGSALCSTLAKGMQKQRYREVLKVMTILENSPVLCAYGLIRCADGRTDARSDG